MTDHTADSIKSLEGFKRAWVEEAQSLTPRSITLLRPTIREPGSQLWFSWNPRRRTDAVDFMLRSNRPTGAVVVRANWSENPWFSAELEQERQDCKRDDADQYGHIWEGDYVTATNGAYFARQLTTLRAEKRLGAVAADPLLRVRSFWDLGVSDSMAIWVAQFVGREIRVLDYVEGAGQPLSYYADALRSRGFGAAMCVLPHDGAERDSVRAVKFEDHLRDAGFEGQVGDAQQAQSQKDLSAALQAYQDGQALTQQQLAMVNSALALLPETGTVTNSGTQSGTGSGSQAGASVGFVI